MAGLPGSMPDRHVPKALPHSKPRYPSHLRNELDQSEIQVPDSQVVIPETQPSTLGRESVPPLSPQSQRILARNSFKPLDEVKRPNDISGVLLSRPKISNDLGFTFSTRRILPKINRNLDMVLEEPRAHRELPHFPLPDEMASNKKSLKSTIEETNLESGPPETQQVAASSEQANLQRNESLLSGSKAIDKQSVGRDAELTAPPMDEGHGHCPEPISKNQTLHREQTTGSSDPSASKGKRSRRHKRQHRPQHKGSGKTNLMDREDLERMTSEERNDTGAVITEGMKDVKLLGNTPHESRDYVIISSGDIDREGSPRDPKDVLALPQESHEEVAMNPEPAELLPSPPVLGVTELPDASKNHVDPRSVKEHAQSNHTEVAHQGERNSQVFFPERNVANSADTASAGRKEKEDHSEMHSVPQMDDAHRVTKKRKQSRTDRASPVADHVNEATSNDSPKYMHFLNLLAQALREDESEAREVRKGHETVIEAQQDATEAKSRTISLLESQHSKSQEEIKRLHNGFQRLQKFLGGIESDHTSLKRHAKSLQQKCDNTLQERLEEIEKEKSEWMENLERTLDTVNQSRRKMKAVLDDCFVRLTMAESRKAAIEKELHQQNELLKEEKRRRQDLEKRILPTIHTMFGRAETRLETVCEMMSSIHQEAADSDQSQREYCEESLGALKTLLTKSTLTNDHVEAVEKKLEDVSEKIDQKLSEMTNSIGKNHSLGTELRQFISVQLQEFRNDMFKCNEAAENCRELQRKNQELLQSHEAQKDICTRLEQQIGSYRENESNLISQRSNLEKKLEHSKTLRLSQYAEISNMRDELGVIESNLRSKIDELATAEEQLREQAESLSEAKRLREIQDAKIFEQAHVIRESESVTTHQNESVLKEMEEQYQLKLKEKEDALQQYIQTVTNERREKEKELKDVQCRLDAIHDSLQTSQEKAEELADKLKTLENEHCTAMDLTMRNFAAEKSKLQQQLADVSGALQLKEGECISLKDDNEKLQTACNRHQECLTQSQIQITGKQSEIDELRAKLDIQVRKYEEMVDGLPELKNQRNLLQTRVTEMEKAAEVASEREKKLKNDQLVMVREVENLKEQLADARKNCETKDIEIQGLHNDKQEEVRAMEERYTKELQEANTRIDAAEKARIVSEATIKRIEHENLGRYEAHEKKTREEFELAVLEKVQERLAERQVDALPSTKKRVIRDNTYTVETLNSICTDVVPETQDFVVWAQNASHMGRSEPEPSLQTRTSTSSLSEVPSDVDGEEDIIDMTEPAVSKAKLSHSREKFPTSISSFQKGISHDTTASYDAKANTGTRVVRQPLALKGSQRKSSCHSQQSSRSEQNSSSDGSQDNESSAYAPSSVSYTDEPEKKSRSREAKRKGGRDAAVSQKLKSGAKRRNKEEHDNANRDKRARLRSSRPPSLPPTRKQGNLGNGTSSSTRKNKDYSQEEMLGRFNYELQTNGDAYSS